MILPKTEQIHSKTDEAVLMMSCLAVAASISCRSSVREMGRLKGRIRALGRKGMQRLIVQGNSTIAHSTNTVTEGEVDLMIMMF